MRGVSNGATLTKVAYECRKKWSEASAPNWCPELAFRSGTYCGVTMTEGWGLGTQFRARRRKTSVGLRVLRSRYGHRSLSIGVRRKPLGSATPPNSMTQVGNDRIMLLGTRTRHLGSVHKLSLLYLLSLAFPHPFFLILQCSGASPLRQIGL